MDAGPSRDAPALDGGSTGGDASSSSDASTDAAPFTEYGDVTVERIGFTDDIDDEHGRAIELDGEDLYIGGGFDQEIDLGGGTLTGSAEGNAFVAALRADGGVRWQRAFGDAEFPDTVKSIALAGTTHVQVAGTAIGTINFGGDDHTSSVRGRAFGFVTSLARADGAWQWDVTWDHVLGIEVAAVDGDRVVVSITGRPDATTDRSFVTALDAATGGELWRHTIERADGSAADAPIRDMGRSQQRIFVLADCDEPASFAGADAPCEGQFLAGLDWDGVLQFIVAAPAPVIASATGPDGMYVVVAHDGADLGTGPLAGRFAVGLVREDGTVPWWRGFETALSTDLDLMTASGRGVYLFGDTGAYIDFGVGRLPREHVFGASMSPAGDLLWLRAWERDPDRASTVWSASAQEGRVAFTISTDSWVDLGEGPTGPMNVARLSDLVWAVLRD